MKFLKYFLYAFAVFIVLRGMYITVFDFPQQIDLRSMVVGLEFGILYTYALYKAFRDNV